MTPRGTDWALAALVALAFATGVLSFFSGHPAQRVVWTLHALGGAALGFATGWKLRRVWRRVLALSRWDRRTWAGVLAALAVGLVIASGVVWSSGGNVLAWGWNLLNWHVALGTLLAAIVLLHALLRAKPLRGRDVRNRRQALQFGGVALASLGLWWAQRPVARAVGWRGADRRWTGSYETGSFAGNAFPATSWIADRPRVLAPDQYRLIVSGLVAQPQSLALADLDPIDTLTATLDCTGGFYTTQHWRGVRLGRLIDQAQPLPSAAHVRIISHTGYRWSFPIDEARELLLATHVGDAALAHGHGAPLRLVAPNHRGFQWIKWVTRIELHEAPDLGAAASTLWSSATPEGRGER